MKHKIAGRKLNRTSAHRKALFRNLAKALIMHEHIKTTLPKAKDLRPIVEKMITAARKGTLHARRTLSSFLQDSYAVKKIMDTLAVRFSERNGGYIRIIKAGFRYGDNAPMAIIQFVEENKKEESKSS